MLAKSLKNQAAKKGLGVIFLLVVLAGLVLWWRSSKVTTAEDSGNLVLADRELALDKTVTTADVDRDGLKDWEETLWHTDPRNPDSDGDGTHDGAEVLEGRNPAVAGPGDELPGEPSDSLPVLGDYSYEYDKTLGDTQTDQVAINLVSNFLEASSRGQYAENEEGLIEEITTEVGRGGDITLFEESDLILSSDNSNQAIRLYLNDLGIIFESDFGVTLDSEYAIFGKLIENQEFDELFKLAEIARGYRRVTDALLKVEVPEPMVTAQLGLVNGFSILSQSLFLMSESGNDPIKLVTGSGRHRQGSTLLTSTIVALKDLARDPYFSFSSDDPAYIFVE